MAPRYGSDDEWEIWHSFLRAYRSVTARLERDLREQFDITVAQYGVLRHLNAAVNHRLPMSELADAVDYSSGAATRLVDPLVKAGLVSRCNDPIDRRRILVTLTGRGASTYARARPVHIASIYRALTARIPESERVTFLDVITRLSDTDHPAD